MLLFSLFLETRSCFIVWAGLEIKLRLSQPPSDGILSMRHNTGQDRINFNPKSLVSDDVVDVL